jgi:UDP-N-acetylmuramoyl-tripeptide--D-alanyl-D-alanine ligase
VSWSCAELAARCGGVLSGDGLRRVAGVSTDTRTLRDGDLFVAVPGERFDGHDFVDQALAKGAAALLLARAAPPGCTAPVIRVADTVAALGALAAAHRADFPGPVVAITGSNGKTTTKEMCFAILCAAGVHAHRSQGNLNNHIGLPLSLLALGAEHDAAVLELGMNHAGEIDALARIASPTVGAITQVAPAHLGHFASVDAIARAKGELLDHIRPGGVAVLNGDDARVMAQAPRFAGRRLVFGLGEQADVRADRIGTDRSGTRFRLSTPWGRAELRLTQPGLHLVEDASCAAAAALASGLLESDPMGALSTGLAGFRGVPGRLTVRETPAGVLVLDDSYNANPTSLVAALDALAALRGKGRALAVVGDMLELGESGPALHAEIGRAVAARGIEVLVAVGALARHSAAAARDAGVARVHEADDSALAAPLVRELVQPGDAVLVKGSRGMRMERIVSALTEAGA